MIETVQDLLNSVANDNAPPPGISHELRSLWHVKKGNWDESHNIAQDIQTPMGSWLHAHLHLVEGDTGNAGYWYSRAGKPSRTRSQIDAEWIELVEANL